jgi:two-component system, OmpR family, response regulator
LSQADLTVLVVDDYPGAADAVVRLLTSAGFRARVARSSRVALDLADRVRPDVVVMDPLMSDGGGWEVAAWLRRRNGTGPSLVALTKGPCDVVDCRAGGFDYLVLKGDDPQTLVAAVALCTEPES